MSESKPNVPKLRFPGFTEPWEQRRLGDCVVGLHVGTNQLGSFEGDGIPLIKMGNMRRGYFVLDKIERLPKQSTVDDDDLIRTGDFIFNTRNTMEMAGKGATWFGPDKQFAFNSNIARLSFSDIDTRFFNYLYNTAEVISQVQARITGTTSVAAIYPASLFTVTISLPSLPEQRLIGAFFRDLDGLIALRQRELDHVKLLKHGLLQKMFPRDSADVPEVRFPGFTDPWKRSKLGDTCSFSKGRGYSKDDLCDSGTPIILYGRLYTQYETRIEEVDTYAEEGEGSLFSSGNEVIVPASGETAEDIAVASSVRSAGIMLGGDLNIIKPDDRIDQDFLALGITYGSAHRELSKRAQGKSIVHLHGSDIAEVDFSFPSKEEQVIISSTILAFDDLIALHQRELDHLKLQKKALLQQMFV